MDKPSHYRAKLQFQTRSFKDQVKAGLYAENSHRLIGITELLRPRCRNTRDYQRNRKATHQAPYSYL